ncbi:hypothetical protein TNCV_141071 [Trichonephila clavipes]|nr:hypothetical protein TNCV_141071 [Trichonephila clavipes]
MIRTWRHGKTQLRVKGDIEDVSSELENLAKMPACLWLVYMIGGAAGTEASDDGACVHAVFAAVPAMKLHFVCRQRGSRMELYTNTELADMHLAYGATDYN